MGPLPSIMMETISWRCLRLTDWKKHQKHQKHQLLNQEQPPGTLMFPVMLMILMIDRA